VQQVLSSLDEQVRMASAGTDGPSAPAEA
jgi:hypothetical protein